ncbi:hypothetical protein E4U17_000881 [Claviceps sp. LM77 group G4]|nr:hypothetical protein E4U17_000881 [Claviceps sp. LM77 group G4]KAG6049269.1 hypothetical protein E4U33_000889 [Claviceps sp. LM78 group G4]
MPPTRRNRSLRSLEGAHTENRRQAPVEMTAPEVMKAAATEWLIDPNSQSGEHTFLCTPHFEPPERIPERHRTITRDMSEAPSEASQPDLGLEIPRTIDAITTSLPPVTLATLATFAAFVTFAVSLVGATSSGCEASLGASYYLCTLDGVATRAVVSSVFCDARDGLFDAQLVKANGMKDQWKHHSIKNTRAFINYCLDETSEGNVPSQTAETFLAARSRRLARPLLCSAFSLDRFEDVFRFAADYLDLGLSTDYRQIIWQDIGVVVLLTELKKRNIPIVIAHDDNFGFTKHAIQKQWDLYGVSHHLEAMRPSVHDVVVITKRSAPARTQQSNPASALSGDEHNPFDTSGFM